MKIAVVYWSGTGNTEIMAGRVLQGAQEKGAETRLYTAAEFSPDMAENFDGIAFGCPAMGDEELDPSEFEPMFSDCREKLSGKKIALFGSYGWGDGRWMRNWEQDCKSAGAIVTGTVIAQDSPDDEAIRRCKALGAALI